MSGVIVTISGEKARELRLERIIQLLLQGYEVSRHDAHRLGSVAVKTEDEHPVRAEDFRTLFLEAVELREALESLYNDFTSLISESRGVYGLHLNGDLAPWESLREDGEFEGWLAGLSKAKEALEKTKRRIR